jgi:spermidine synthase
LKQVRQTTDRYLFLASFVALYFELVIIRYLSTELRVFAYLKNMPLIASFLGIGIGMILGARTLEMREKLPGLMTFFFLIMWTVARLGKHQFGLPTPSYMTFGSWRTGSPEEIFAYCVFVTTFLYLVVRMFIPLGGLVGEQLSQISSPLRAYSLNLAGSVAGIGVFTALSFLGTGPGVWLAVGFMALLAMLPKQVLPALLFLGISAFASLSTKDDYWSPYYHIALSQASRPAPDAPAGAYEVSVNHDYHQRMMNLSQGFLDKYPSFEPNRTARQSYELPYRLKPSPQDVLIVGAGTGNDVAAALRNGARRVDAVEIDPTILALGRRLHPEHPYDSENVHVYNDDARAFFKRATSKYDLIVFAYLDSHTMFSSFSSMRLDNFVYTRESFAEAHNLLKPDGALILAFAGSQSFVTVRLLHGLADVFGQRPRVFETGYDTSGMVFVAGNAIGAGSVKDYPELSDYLAKFDYESATDNWPFLYLERHTVPWPIWSILLLLVVGSIYALRILFPGRSLTSTSTNLHFFMLGAGFLLLETKAVTQLSLLCGSTWMVNSVVIAAFLCMALAANALVAAYPVSYKLAYSGLFISLVIAGLFPLAALNAFPLVTKMFTGGLITALPVFFSGMIFSRSMSEADGSAQALGVNLLGAVVGGALENVVMIGGSTVLAPLAAFLYVASALTVIPRRSVVTERG